jgi:hypothetical protein
LRTFLARRRYLKRHGSEGTTEGGAIAVSLSIDGFPG